MAVRIPFDAVAAMRLRAGMAMQVDVSEGRLILRPEHYIPLEVLLEEVTDENRQPEVEWGPAHGREEW